MQVLRRIHRRALLVALGIVLRRAHVTLGIDAVVIAPVSDGASRDSHLERLAVRQCIARHEPTITPAPDTNARAVNVRLALQPRHTIFEIAQFELAEIFINRPRRFHPLAARGAIVTDPDDVALLRQQLMKHVSLRTPTIPHLRRMWTTVSE